MGREPQDVALGVQVSDPSRTDCGVGGIYGSTGACLLQFAGRVEGRGQVAADGGVIATVQCCKFVRTMAHAQSWAFVVSYWPLCRFAGLHVCIDWKGSRIERPVPCRPRTIPTAFTDRLHHDPIFRQAAVSRQEWWQWKSFPPELAHRVTGY